MNRKTTAATTFAILTLGIYVATTATAGDLNPPPGPVSPTGPSLDDLNTSINNINPGSGGADIGQITTVVDNANADINSNTNAGFDALAPRGNSLYNVLIRIDGLVGTSSIQGYTDFIPVETAELFSAVVLDSGPGGNDPGQPMISSVKVTTSDQANNNTPQIFQSLTMGTNVSMDVVFLQQGGNLNELMRISFDQSFITAFELTEAGYELEISPKACVTISTREFDQQGNPSSGTITVGWDLQSGLPCN